MRYLLLLMSLLLPSLAMAQNMPSAFTPDVGSKAMVILASIFGELGVFGPNGGDPFSTVISVFNGAVLVIGGILVSYTWFMGIVGTAHDGEVMGKKIHSAWMPIRLALGTALIIPLGSVGYCGIQYIVGLVITLSIGIADRTWATFVGHENLNKTLAVGLVRQDTKQLGYTLLQSHVCVEAFKKITQDPNVQMVGGGLSDFGLHITSTDEETIYQFGDRNRSNGFSYTSCGSVKVPRKQVAVIAPATHSIFTPANITAESEQRQERIRAFGESQYNILYNAMQAQAVSLVGGGTLDPNTIDTLVNNYELAVRNNASREITSINAFQEVSANASQDGFVGMATFYQKLNYLTDLVTRSMAKVPVATSPNIPNSIFKDEYVKYYADLNNVLNKTKKAQGFGASFEKGGSNEIGSISLNATQQDSDYDLNGAMKNSFASYAESFVLGANEHPVSATKRLGNALLFTAGTGWVVGEGLSMATYNLKIAGYGIGEPLSRAIHDTTNTATIAMVMAGFVLSYIVPFAPTVLIIGAIIGWTIACIEAILIAPLWAVMHLSPSGDDMVGTGKQGYRLLLNLLCKPTFLVFGVIASIVLLPVFGNLIQTIFYDTFMNMNQDSNFIIYMVSLVFSPLIYGGLVFMVIKRLFNAMVEIADNMMAWITNSDTQLGSSAKQIAGDGGLGGGAGGGGGYNVASTAVVGIGAKGVTGTFNSVRDGYVKDQQQANQQEKQQESEKVRWDNQGHREMAMNQRIGDVDKSVYNGLKNSGLSIEDRNDQAHLYGQVRQQFRGNSELLSQVENASNLSEINPLIETNPNFYGRSFADIQLREPPTKPTE